MRPVTVATTPAAAARRFLWGVLEGVGSMVTGSMVGGARVSELGASESDCVVAAL